MQSIPSESGIYQILCIPTQKIYIGSTINLHLRWRDHSIALRKGTHSNPYLQHAWNKYGEARFCFSVLELVDAPELLDAEQKWIDKTRCTDENIGFNIAPRAGSSLGIKRRLESRQKVSTAHSHEWDGFIDPEGNLISITNLWNFCRERGLNFGAMHRLATGQGRTKSYKGWTHRDNPKQEIMLKIYEGFIDPQGNQVGPITRLKVFCCEQGLSHAHMHEVYVGKRFSHNGWTHAQRPRKPVFSKAYYGFISPEGVAFSPIQNLRAFCREHGLLRSSMDKLYRGIIQNHRGWTCVSKGRE
jgi:group I intron endonuclease